ncbi:hypothetical protein V5O48_016499 [Marasmius crinis-equi]|uniref:Uncharacterized protein n=1 Tax=Marasmius crinis-equi TaxID=585013 RepID=A0ABR3ERJ4_9AGAR
MSTTTLPEASALSNNSDLDDSENLQSQEEDVLLSYKLSPLIAGIKESWQYSLANSAVVGSVFAAVSAALIQTYKLKDEESGKLTPGNLKHYRYLMAVSYVALFLNASVTVTSLILIDKLGGVLKVSSKRKNAKSDPREGYWVSGASTPVRDLDLLKKRIEKFWLFRIHCMHCELLTIYT